MTRGFLFDLNRCTGCHACRLACTVENDLPWGESWRDVPGFNPENDPRLPLFHLSLACNHCDDAPCMSSCPALAYRRDAGTGAVLIDETRCIGCRYCSWACPYDAPLYSPAGGVMTKCTLCRPRLEQGLDPACVATCPTGALEFGEMDGPIGSAAKREPGTARRRDRTVPGFADHGIGPRIRFTPLRDDRWPEGAAGSGPAAGGAHEDPARDRPPSVGRSGGDAGFRRLSWRSEWPLAAFTLLAAASVSVFAAAALAERPAPWPAWLLPGAAGMAVSLVHLGRRGRAWRAALNLRRSWVSREIVLFTLFLALAAASSFPGARRPWEWPAVYAGFFALWAMDRVYASVRARGTDRFHSAEVLDTGLYLAGWLAGWPLLAGLIGLYKLALFLRRKIRAARAGEPIGRAWAVARVVLGFAIPLGLSLDRPEAWPLMAFASALAGEVIDRLEFYAGLRLPAPRMELERERIHRLADGQGSRRAV